MRINPNNVIIEDDKFLCSLDGFKGDRIEFRLHYKLKHPELVHPEDLK